MVASPVERGQRPTGSSTAIAKFCSTDGRALGFARAGRGSERSAEFGSDYSYSLPSRARARLGGASAARPAWPVQRLLAARW